MHEAQIHARTLLLVSKKDMQMLYQQIDNITFILKLNSIKSIKKRIVGDETMEGESLFQKIENNLLVCRVVSCHIPSRPHNLFIMNFLRFFSIEKCHIDSRFFLFQNFTLINDNMLFMKSFIHIESNVCR